MMSASLSTGMNFYDQDRRSLLWRAGAFINYDTHTSLGPLLAYSRVAYEKEFKDDPRYVRAGLNTLPGSSFELPGYQSEKYFWLFNLGLGTKLFQNWTAVMSYHMRKGQTDSLNHGIQLSIWTRF